MSLKDLLFNLRQPFAGRALSFGRPGSQIQVSANGKIITAIAANHINSTNVSVVIDANGQAWVRSPTSPIQINRRTGLFFHIQEDEEMVPVYYPLKILFSLENNEDLDLYIGGDRPNPKLVYTINSIDRSNLMYSYFSNTGKTLNDFAIGLKFTDKLITIQANNIYTYQGLAFDRLIWKSGGFWGYSLNGEGLKEVNRQQIVSGNSVTTDSDYIPNDSLLTGVGHYHQYSYSSGGSAS